MDQVFTDVFARESQLLKADPRNHTYIACAFLMRGNATISDINRNLARVKPNLKMVPWNADGFKIGLCSVPPAQQPYSLLNLANNCAIAETFSSMEERFSMLYKRQFYLHHYTEYMEKSGFEEAHEEVRTLIDGYQRLEGTPAPEMSTRYQPI